MKFYHLSKSKLPDGELIQPRIPQSAVVETEGNIPRICVTDDIILALQSICSTSVSRGLCFLDLMWNFLDPKLTLLKQDIYDLYEKSKQSNSILMCNIAVYGIRVNDEKTNMPFLPPDCADFRRFREHWYLQPQPDLKFIGYLDWHALFNGAIRVIEEEPNLHFHDFFNHVGQKLLDRVF